jgi:hypothetical protein
MTIATVKDWRTDFGISQRKPPTFFASKDDLASATRTFPQAHVLRRAFDLLQLDGVLCTDNSPLIYFKQMVSLDAAEVIELHRRFWNHGGAPILVLIAPNEVQIYSGLTRPVAVGDAQGRLPSLVEIINRTSAALREFLPAVESGEFFRRHSPSFNPEHRVDRALLDNLQATREKLVIASSRALDPQVLDALLCRLVFTCYLFDRGVIGANYLDTLAIKNTSHLRDVLGTKPRSTAKTNLYRLFKKLGEDFNGDLFSDDLDKEASLILAGHIDLLDAFFRATDVRHGQQSFWPYDFGVIPIETISAIYERFLKQSDKQVGSFYTPRFLAEVVLDTALIDTKSLLDQRCLDPACGSGIFLVGLFNRMAEEWKQAHPEARNDRRARELMSLLRASVFGVDVNPTACRITAFSLYLAYLDQLSPRDIQELQQKGRALPRLVNAPDDPDSEQAIGNIWCADFFATAAKYPNNVNLVVGNPPWGSIATDDTAAAHWCAAHGRPIPDKQIAAAFMWKATKHTRTDGKICFVLPHGTLFNHSKKALAFQRDFFLKHAVDRILNLTDYQFFLFEEARHPAIVMSYRTSAPANDKARIDYLAPKADWIVRTAEIITVMPEDRSIITVRELLNDLDEEDAPQIWKRRFRATPRDWRLIDRLSQYSRLRDHVRQPRKKDSSKPWLMAVGFQPFGETDSPKSKKSLELPGNLFVPAKSTNLDLLLLEEDCERLRSKTIDVRRLIKDTGIFRAPHVLVAKGLTSTAFADFDVSFQDAVRGISGPKADRNLLIFLSAYLRSSIARYFLFHTSSNWGVSRQEVHVEEMLRLPFPLPDSLPDPRRSWEIVNEIAGLISSMALEARKPLADRSDLVKRASKSIEPLVEEYFDFLSIEKAIVEDTIRIIIPSVRPTRSAREVPTIEPSTDKQQTAYVNRLCATLNEWAKSGAFVVKGRVTASSTSGIGLTVLEKTKRSDAAAPPVAETDLLNALDGVRKAVAQKLNTFEMARGVKMFDGARLYIVKPLGQRYWTQTAALNDADEIAGTILMNTPKGAG